MTQNEFIKSLDFESVKNTIARKLSIKPDTLTIKVIKNGVFEIDLKNANNPTGALVNGAKRAVLAVTRTDIGEATDSETGKPTGVFAYNADISIIIKNGEMEYTAKVGELDFVKNKLIFSTVAEILAQETAAKAKQKATRDAIKAEKVKAEKKKSSATKKTTSKPKTSKSDVNKSNSK